MFWMYQNSSFRQCHGRVLLKLKLTNVLIVDFTRRAITFLALQLADFTFRECCNYTEFKDLKRMTVFILLWKCMTSLRHTRVAISER